MTLPDFYNRIEDSFGDYIVGVRLKYNHENRYRVYSEVLTVTDDGVEWLNDWFEGEEEVEILGYIKVDSIIFCA